MKLNNQPYRTVALLLLVLLAAACTGEDDFVTPPDEGTASAAPLTITVTDGAYAPAQSPDGGNTPDTRAVERDYGTEFTKGDQIGLYVVAQEDASNQYSNRTFLQQNLCLTHDGTDWTLPAGTELTYQPPEGGEILYFAYYPYQGGMTDKVNIYAKNENGTPTTEARWFFGPLINGWQPADDQSTYEAYTANDLMVARGEVAKRTDGTDGFVLSFTMEHQMTLAVIRVPTTKYTYTETIGGKSKEKSYRLYSGVPFPEWLANDDTYRLLVKPLTFTMRFGGFYYNASLEKRSFDVEYLPKSPGQYFLRTIDGGEETVTDRPLSEGDFYMKDGTIIPRENVNGNMPADVQKDCLGVVFWVGEKDGLHWTQTGIWNGDQLLMRDHPGCVHGMVVALRDASDSGQEWSSSNEALYEWAQSYVGFTKKETEDLGLINQSNLFYGYCCSRRLGLFKAKTGNTTNAYDAILDYAGSHPVPYSCSGWFFPGKFELTCIWSDSPANRNESIRIKELNEMLSKAGGVGLKEKHYWSSYDVSDKAFSMNMSPNLSDFNNTPKTNANYVRAVLAF